MYATLITFINILRTFPALPMQFGKMIHLSVFAKFIHSICKRQLWARWRLPPMRTMQQNTDICPLNLFAVHCVDERYELPSWQYEITFATHAYESDYETVILPRTVSNIWIGSCCFETVTSKPMFGYWIFNCWSKRIVNYLSTEDDSFNFRLWTFGQMYWLTC